MQVLFLRVTPDLPFTSNGQKRFDIAQSLHNATAQRVCDVPVLLSKCKHNISADHLRGRRDVSHNRVLRLLSCAIAIRDDAERSSRTARSVQP